MTTLWVKYAFIWNLPGTNQGLNLMPESVPSNPEATGWPKRPENTM